MIEYTKYAAFAVLLLAGMYLGFYVGSCNKTPEIITEIVYKDRQIVERDTITVDRPVTRYIYQTVTDTVEKKIYVPVDFDMAGIISHAPIKIDRDEVTLTWFDPDSMRFVQDRFVVQRPNWSVEVALSADHLPGYTLTSMKGIVRYKRFSGHIGYGVYGSGGFGLVFGVQISLIKWAR